MYPLTNRLSASVSSQLHDVDVTEPWIYAAAAAVLVAAALLGFLVPARKAVTIDPVKALHFE